MKIVSQVISFFLLTALISGCALRENRTSVWARTMPTKQAAIEAERDWRPSVHVVQKGDTLYSIAFNYGLDYHEVAELNRIPDPSIIKIGQSIQLFSADSPRPVSAPIKSAVDSAPIDAPNDGRPAAENDPAEILIKEQPLAVKLEYSEQAMLQIEKIQLEQSRQVARPQIALVVIPNTKKIPIAVEDAKELSWSMPAQGKLTGEFSAASGSNNRKGISIAGKLRQPVLASATGKVVYNGNGLRGYGNLVIIKHNKTFISAYAHNDRIVVKEGQMVKQGQKIAEMGNTDTDQVKLYFEIRKFGKPVDPAQYLKI